MRLATVVDPSAYNGPRFAIVRGERVIDVVAAADPA